MSEIVSGVDFSEARVGDRVYTPLFKCKKGYRTNAIISKIFKDRLEVEVLIDKPTPFIRYPTFGFDGSFIGGGGQVLFWENPIKEISIRSKRKVTKKGWIGISLHSGTIKNCIANTTYIYSSEEPLTELVDKYTIQQIEYEVEE